MTENIIHAPNVRLFTYHLKTVRLADLTQNEIEIADIEDLYRSLLELYGALVPQDRLLQTGYLPNLPNVDLLITKKPGKRGILQLKSQSNKRFKLFAYTQLLTDTYSLSLTSYFPQKFGKDGVEFSELASLKPPPAFFSGTAAKLDVEKDASFKQAFWGSTVMLSGFLPREKPQNPQDLKTTADRCLQNFLKESLEDSPPFYCCGEFLGGYIYEYGNPRVSHPYGHIVILFIFCEATTEHLKSVQWYLPEIFLYYHKNTRNFQDSQKEYKAAMEESGKIEQAIKTSTANSAASTAPELSEEQLENLKGDIKNFLSWSLQYSQRLRSIRIFQNTISINRENYINKIRRLERLTSSELNVWRGYADRNFQRFERQIEADLGYLDRGSQLLDTAIASIRGIVEIDQAKRDRDRQQAEKERDRLELEQRRKAEEKAEAEQKRLEQAEKNLQDQIQAIGVGVGAGAIVASTASLMFEKPFVLKGDRLHPFTIAVLFSAGCAILFWKIAKCWLARQRR
ncbi:MAG: hypothetical protein F6J93_04665 [Oscillatoria sp. SIO1A7]|nr:hypothetical protein [Oscillatoria sp. SIO1A7]